MIKCVIIDDEQPAINVLEKYIKRIENLQLVGTATDPLKGIELIKNNGAEVAFLDIQMDEMTGIEVMNMLGQTVMTHLTQINGSQMSEYINLPQSTASGNYIVRVTVGKNVYTAKVNISK